MYKAQRRRSGAGTACARAHAVRGRRPFLLDAARCTALLSLHRRLVRSPWTRRRRGRRASLPFWPTPSATHPRRTRRTDAQARHFHELLVEDLIDAPGSLQAKAKGVLVGTLASTAILARRAHDGAAHAESRMGVEYIPGVDPGEWRQDPISQAPIALGHHWGEVQPFVLASGDQFRVPPFPALTSSEYAQAYD